MAEIVHCVFRHFFATSAPHPPPTRPPIYVAFIKLVLNNLVLKTIKNGGIFYKTSAVTSDLLINNMRKMSYRIKGFVYDVQIFSNAEL